VKVIERFELTYDEMELEKAREAFIEYVDETNMRYAAYEARLDGEAQTVKSILKGGKLNGKTILRLIDWYRWCTNSSEVDEMMPNQAIRILIQYIKRGSNPSKRRSRRDEALKKIWLGTSDFHEENS